MFLQLVRPAAGGEDTRRRAYEAENKAWEEVKETLAACLNGVKGEANTLNKKRGRKDAIHSSLDTARMDRKTLEAMLAKLERPETSAIYREGLGHILEQPEFRDVIARYRAAGERVREDRLGL